MARYIYIVEAKYMGVGRVEGVMLLLINVLHGIVEIFVIYSWYLDDRPQELQSVSNKLLCLERVSVYKALEHGALAFISAILGVWGQRH